MNGWRRVMGWGALGCSNLTTSGARGGVARDVTKEVHFFVTSLAYTPLSVHPYRVVFRPCQVTAAQCTPAHHPSPPIHTGWVVASGNQTPNLTFNTPGTPEDATSCAAAQLVASAGEPGLLKVRLGVRFPLTITHPI